MLRCSLATSPLLELARSGRRPPTLWRPLVLYALLWVGQLLLAVALGLVLFLAFWAADMVQRPGQTTDLGQRAISLLLQSEWAGYLGLPTFLLMWGLVWIFVRFWEDRPLRTIGLQASSLGDRGPARGWLQGAGLGGGMMIVTAALLTGLGLARVEAAPDLHQAGWLALSLGFFVVQGAAEEVVHRGYLLPVLGARCGPWAGIAASSTMFALLHSLNPGLRCLGWLNLFLSGLFLALLSLLRGNLWSAFGWHAAWNWVQGPVLGFPVSGDRSWAAHSLLQLTPVHQAPGWIGGEAFGPEGGVVVTVLLLSAIGLLLIWQQLTSSPRALG